MAYLKNLFKIYYFTQVILAYNAYFCVAVTTEIKGNLPKASIIYRILNEFLGPVMRSFPNVVLNNFQELVDKTIREKIKELQPLLQDNDMMAYDENMMLEDKDDTTILEFLPKTEEHKKKIEDPFKSNLKKYKKIREKINKALTKESVSVKTKNLVVKTLDVLIKTLLSSQCKWKSRAVKSEKPSDIANKWNKGLQNIKDVLLSFLKNRSVPTRRNDDVLNFLNALKIMFRSITEDVDVISKKYKILCDFVPKEHNYPKDAMNANALRDNWDITDLEEDRCRNIVVCSNELKEFLRNFYFTLNDTNVSLLKNYVDMYTRDVIVENENEKDIIISILNKITTGLEEGIIKVFVKETQKLMLDKEKRNHANVNILSNYVANTIKTVQDFAKQLLKSELLVLRDKILAVILDDLNVNLDVDLGNLEREFVRKICAMFRLCNGRYRGRRQGSSDLNKDNLHVQVLLTLASDNTTDITNNSYRKFLNEVTSRNNTVNRFTSSMGNVTVTRTTLINNVTNW
ncbi:uncharacterized protein LOC123874067 [Maniola jurtina]|uniref:uncharacterized protein LOC123874067 n=1 Tax=Maniola jurtina TaxID=191418 RepID=UPI001E68AC19|nr:uncharacterized protein LOC123874067 [Maniola jurtina]